MVILSDTTGREVGGFVCGLDFFFLRGGATGPSAGAALAADIDVPADID